MEPARVVAGIGYLVVLAVAAGAIAVHLAAFPGLVGRVPESLVATVRSVPVAGFGALLVLALWGGWRLVGP